MPDRHPKVWKVLHLLASSQSVQFMPFCLPPESSTLHIKNVPSRMQCKQCRRKVQLLGEAGMSWEASPYTWGARGEWKSGLPGAQSPPSMAAGASLGEANRADGVKEREGSPP